MDSSHSHSPFATPSNSSTSISSRGSPGSALYPDISGALHEMDSEVDDDDVLAALGIPPIPKPSKPQRPPPPKFSSVPANLGAAVPPKNDQDKELQLFQNKLESVSIPPLLGMNEVRWFYQEPGKFWKPFQGHDSMAIEKCYRRHFGNDPSWMEGQWEDSEDGTGKYEVTVMGDLHLVDIEHKTVVPIYWTIKETWKVMRGYWFEVVGEKWYPFPEDESTAIEEEHLQKRWREKAKKDADLQMWANSSLTASTTTPAPKSSGQPPPKGQSPSPQENIVVVNRLSTEKYEIWWLANGEIHKIKKEVTAQLWKKFGEKLGKGSLYGGTKVMRGYKDIASEKDRLPPIGHVVFVIHGIGQQMNSSNIETSTSDFRDTCTKVAKKNFADDWKEKRVEFIPVEWRTWLSLDKGLVGKITPQGLKILRGLVNDCVLDVFYYFSPRYGPEILDGLKFALHKQYNEFIMRHPYFIANGGTVSVIAHSLGSVMMYDILRQRCELDPEIAANLSSSSGSRHSSVTVEEREGGKGGGGVRAVDVGTGEKGSAVKFVAGLYSPESSVEEADTPDLTKAAMQSELEELKKRVSYLEHKLALNKPPAPLSFSIDHFFAFGSPMSLFIAMKEHETLVTRDCRSTASILPSAVCKRIHNLHHPSDPIAYRLEPLVNPMYTQVKPVKVGMANAKISKEAVDHAEGPKTDEQLQPMPKEKSWLANVGHQLLNLATKKVSGELPAKLQASEKMLDCDEKFNPENKLRERLDFTLRESVMENSYLNSITAHYSYWSSADCAQYVLLQIYKYRQSDSM